MSSRTCFVAVAVYAWIAIAGKTAFSAPSSRYSGRKSWPHIETQWASSTAMKDSERVFRSRRKASIISRSGDTYRIFTSPPRSRVTTSSRSTSEWPLWRWSAATPRSTSASTWSFISEISGETTIAVPGRWTAGTW